MNSNTCGCGADQRRAEQRSGENRIITLTCVHCGKREVETQSKYGKLIRWQRLPAVTNAVA
jgi:hypothetical protein